MKEIVDNTRITIRKIHKGKKAYLQGYPLYPAREDIYNKYDKEEDLSNIEEPDDIVKSLMNNKNDLRNNLSDSDLYIPNSELDDNQEFDENKNEDTNNGNLGLDDNNEIEENELQS